MHEAVVHGFAGQARAFDNASWWSFGLKAVAVIPALDLPGKDKTTATAVPARTGQEDDSRLTK